MDGRTQWKMNRCMKSEGEGEEAEGGREVWKDGAR